MGRWNKDEDGEPRYRKPDKGALHVRQVPALGEEYRVWIARHATKLSLKHFDHKAGQEGILNALLAEFLTLPLAEQLRRLRAGLEIAEAAEREWNREMRPLVESGAMIMDEKRYLWTPEEWAEKQAKKAGQAKPDSKSESEPVRKPTPKNGRKRA